MDWTQFWPLILTLRRFPIMWSSSLLSLLSKFRFCVIPVKYSLCWSLRKYSYKTLSFKFTKPPILFPINSIIHSWIRCKWKLLFLFLKPNQTIRFCPYSFKNLVNVFSKQFRGEWGWGGVLSNIKHGGTVRLCLASFSFNNNKHILNYTN